MILQEAGHRQEPLHLSHNSETSIAATYNLLPALILDNEKLTGARQRQLQGRDPCFCVTATRTKVKFYTAQEGAATTTTT